MHSTLGPVNFSITSLDEYDPTSSRGLIWSHQIKIEIRQSTLPYFDINPERDIQPDNDYQLGGPHMVTPDQLQDQAEHLDRQRTFHGSLPTTKHRVTDLRKISFKVGLKLKRVKRLKTISLFRF